MSKAGKGPQRLRKQYTNTSYPHIVLRFEDGHEIHLPRGVGKTFDAWAGETVKICAVYDPTLHERELIESKRADDFANGE